MTVGDGVIWVLVGVIVFGRLVQIGDWLARRRLERYRRELAESIIEGLNLVGMLLLISDVDSALEHTRRLKSSVRILAGLKEEVDA